MAGFQTRDLKDMAREEHRIAHEPIPAVTPGPRVTLAAYLEEARRALQEAKQAARRAEDRETFIWLCQKLGEIDGKRAALAESWGS